MYETACGSWGLLPDSFLSAFMSHYAGPQRASLAGDQDEDYEANVELIIMLLIGTGHQRGANIFTTEWKNVLKAAIISFYEC